MEKVTICEILNLNNINSEKTIWISRLKILG